MTRKELEKLRDDAIAGDKLSAFQLLMIGIETAHCLREVAEQNPAALLPFSRATAFFPALICPNKSLDEQHQSILSACQVGHESDFKKDSTTALRLDRHPDAVKLYLRIQEIRDGLSTDADPEITTACRALPNPGRDTFDAWESVGNRMLPKELEAYDKAQWCNTLNNPNYETNGRKVDAIRKQILQDFRYFLRERAVDKYL
jgi:hypothetical protein